MITNNNEFKVTQQRIQQFQHWLANIRQTARPDEFEAVTSGYRLEIERMHAEVMDYLLRPLLVANPITPSPKPAERVLQIAA